MASKYPVRIKFKDDVDKVAAVRIAARFGMSFDDFTRMAVNEKLQNAVKLIKESLAKKNAEELAKKVAVDEQRQATATTEALQADVTSSPNAEGDMARQAERSNADSNALADAPTTSDKEDGQTGR